MNVLWRHALIVLFVSFSLVATATEGPFLLATKATETPSPPKGDAAYTAGRPTVSSGLAFFLSAAVPGTGQLYAGTKRGYAYFLAEAALLTGYVLTRRDAEQKRDDFFQEVRAGVTFDGNGSFDTWNSEDFEHATLFDNWHNVYNDENGIPIERTGKWYWSDREEFKTANPLEGEEILPSEQRKVALTLRNESNDRFKQARFLVGVVLFNHLVSAIDARLSARSRNRKVEAERSSALRMRWMPNDGSFSRVAMLWESRF